MDDKASGYIDKQPSPQKEVCRRLRKLILGTFPGIGEEMRMGVPWYEGRFYIVALKDHVNLGFSVKGLSKDEASRLEGGGKLMRHLKFRSPADIDEKRVVGMLKLVKAKSRCEC